MTLKVDGTNGVLQAYDYQASTTGFSYTFAAGTQTLLINPADTLATGTITMPASPADGMTITFSSTKQITTLTVNANTGQSITGTPGTLPANTTMAFVYRLANTTWYPMQTSPNGMLCRAWGTFQGASGTIDASYNVSSVTRNSTGDYTINYTNAMPNANYAWVGSCSQNLSANPANFCIGYPDNSSLQTYSTTQTRVTTKAGYPSGMADVPRATFAVFGG